MMCERVEEDLMTVFPKESWSKLHLQFIYFGREHCQVRNGNVSRESIMSDFCLPHGGAGS